MHNKINQFLFFFLSVSAHTLNKLLTSFLTTGSESILEHIIDTFAQNEAPVV